MSTHIVADRDMAMQSPERRVRRVRVPDCPSCHEPLIVDVRSDSTLYARCQRCGHRRMVDKTLPDLPERQQR